MALWCNSTPQFMPGDKVVSLVYHHPPEIQPGTTGDIASCQVGGLYAVQLPNGELHRWFAGFELESLSTGYYYNDLLSGSLAKIVSTKGHPQHIKEGITVRIVQAIASVPYYEVWIKGKSHRWLAEFELAAYDVVSQSM